MIHSTPQSEWAGPQPLHNPLGVRRLGEIYSRTAAFYDGLVAQQQSRAKLAAIERLARRPRERFLEIGVGTGWAFARLLQSGGSENAFGLDLAAGMLDVARGVLAERGIRPVRLLLGDARALPFANGAFDCILNTYTFEVLPSEDIQAVIEESRRVLRPGGRTAIVNLTDATGGAPEDVALIEAWKRGYAADPEFYGGARPLQLREMLLAHGFERVTREYVGPDWPSEVLEAYRPR